MSRCIHITVTDVQFDYLTHASDRTSLSVAELIRRAVDEKYHPSSRGQSDSEFTVAVWRRAQEAAPGGRRGVSLDR